MSAWRPRILLIFHPISEVYYCGVQSQKDYSSEIASEKGLHPLEGTAEGATPNSAPERSFPQEFFAIEKVKIFSTPTTKTFKSNFITHRTMKDLQSTEHTMEIHFLSATLAMPAVAVGLHWRHLTRNRRIAPKAEFPEHARQHQTPLMELDEYVSAALASMDDRFAGITARLERIEAKIDLLPSKVH